MNDILVTYYGKAKLNREDRIRFVEKARLTAKQMSQSITLLTGEHLFHVRLKRSC